MSKFKTGDRVRHTFWPDSAPTAILGVHEDLYWMKTDGDRWPRTAIADVVDTHYALIPEEGCNE